MQGYEWVLYQKPGSLAGVERESTDSKLYTSDWHSAITLPSTSLSRPAPPGMASVKDPNTPLYSQVSVLYSEWNPSSTSLFLESV